MKTWVRKTLSVGVLAAGALLFTSANAAQADDKVTQDTSWNYGIGNGIQAAAPIDLGANVCGNAVSALGFASGQAACGNVFEGGHYKQKSTKNFGALNGAQVLIPVDGGVNVVGNAVAAAGGSQAAGTGVNSFGGHGKSEESARTEKKGGDPTQLSHGNYGLLNGAQIYAPINLGANVCGNSASVLGLANSQAACWNLFGGKGKGKQENGIEQVTYDNYGALNGLQLAAPINGFANVTGNAASVGGAAHAAGASKNTESGGDDNIKQNSTQNFGIANGLQVAAPVDLGLNLCGNSLGVLGAANSAASCGNDFGGGNGGHHNGGDNGGDNGDDDDYDHDGGDNGDDDNAGDNGNDADNYGDAPRQDAKKADKSHAKSATEGSAVDGLAGGLGGNNANVAGLTGGLLKTLG